MSLIDKIKGNKTVLYGGGAVVAVAGIIWFRHRAAASAASASTGTAATDTGLQTDPAGNVGIIDPETGFVEGSPEDEQALQNTFGAGAGIPIENLGDSGAGTGTTSSTGSLTTNTEWLAKAENVLPNGHSSTVVTALTKVLGGVAVTHAQRALFLEAKGVVGSPPDGYPPIKLTDTGGHPSSPPGKGVKPHSVIASGKLDLQKIAEAAGISEAQIRKLNPLLASKYSGTGKAIPKGQEVKV